MNANKSTPCPKAGIKIHETNYQQEQMQLQNHPKTNRVNFYNTPMSELDLNLDNYSLNDLFNLFNINDEILDDDVMKNAKNITLKMHPDKSHLDPKFFIFFRKAYNRLTEIYEFQNKAVKKQQTNVNATTIKHTYDTSNDLFGEDNRQILNELKNKKQFKNTGDFNGWFNENFEKFRVDDPNEKGYGDWLKSNEGFINIDENVTKSNMNEIFEQKKKQVQSLTVYTGIQNDMASFRGSTFSMLNDGDNFTSDYYTDLKQAYTETVIPVTIEDYEKMPKYNNVNEYMTHRKNVDVTPIDRTEAMRILETQERNAEKESQALAYRYAKEAEKTKEQQNLFWSALKQITG